MPTPDTLGPPFTDYVDVLEGARLLGIHHESLRRLVNQQRVPAPIVFNRKWLWPRTEFLAWAATYRNRIKATA